MVVITEVTLVVQLVEPAAQLDSVCTFVVYIVIVETKVVIKVCVCTIGRDVVETVECGTADDPLCVVEVVLTVEDDVSVSLEVVVVARADPTLDELNGVVETRTWDVVWIVDEKTCAVLDEATGFVEWVTSNNDDDEVMTVVPEDDLCCAGRLWLGVVENGVVTDRTTEDTVTLDEESNGTLGVTVLELDEVVMRPLDDEKGVADPSADEGMLVDELICEDPADRVDDDRGSGVLLLGAPLAIERCTDDVAGLLVVTRVEIIEN